MHPYGPIHMDGFFWGLVLVQHARDELARAVARARFYDMPQFLPRPPSPDMRSHHSRDSYDTNDPNRRGDLAEQPVNAHFPPERAPASRERSHSPGRPRRPRGRDHRNEHGNEVLLNAIQVAESAALTQVRGIFDIVKWLSFSDNGALTAQAVINNMTVAAEGHLIKNHPNLARSWTPQMCKAWMLADFRPVQTSSSSTHAKLA